jgi:hypothetical protein
MKTNTTSPYGSGTPGRYFFLSYPRLPLLPAVPGTELADPPDEWVRGFFRDLTMAVRDRAGQGSRLAPGFLDLETPARPDSKAALTDGLSTAEVFVPLLSPEYLSRSWPRREWASFQQRLRNAHVAEPWRRFAPVLWVPPSGGQSPPGLADALSLAHGSTFGPYAENGLRALLRLTRYRGCYEQVVGELATRIVSIAEKTPVGSSPAQNPEQTAPFSLGPTGKDFAVVVTASVLPAMPRRGDGIASGAAGSARRPFGDTRGPALAEYARLAAEQLGFCVWVTGFDKSVDRLHRTPGVILVDPSFTAGPDAPDAFRAQVGELPSWVLPVVVAGQASAEQIAEIRTFLDKKYKPYKYQPDVVRRGLRGVRSLREFVTLMPFLVAQAEREYLRHGPNQSSASRAAFRPRLAGLVKPANPPIKENPDV